MCKAGPSAPDAVRSTRRHRARRSLLDEEHRARGSERMLQHWCTPTASCCRAGVSWTGDRDARGPARRSPPACASPNLPVHARARRGHEPARRPQMGAAARPRRTIQRGCASMPPSSCLPAQTPRASPFRRQVRGDLGRMWDAGAAGCVAEVVPLLSFHRLPNYSCCSNTPAWSTLEPHRASSCMTPWVRSHPSASTTASPPRNQSRLTRPSLLHPV